MSSTIKRALISVYDKTGIVDFARGLTGEFGIEILSTGGTAKRLKESGVPVTLVEDVTGSGEMLDGRVKTLHPKIHAAILADRDNPDHMRQLQEAGIKPIDMVVVNLYPFEATIAKPGCTFDEAVEMIDIGGPCMLRAAAKNHKHVLVVSRPDTYQDTLQHLRDWGDERCRRDALATGAFFAFDRTFSYDAQVASWLSTFEQDNLPGVRMLDLRSWGRLRYGENPHQSGEILSLKDDARSGGLDLIAADAGVVCGPSGKKISFNNYIDANAAAEVCQDISLAGMPHIACMIKHTNPCGVGVADDPAVAYRNAYLGDPKAAMGGILAVNFPVDKGFAQTVMDSLKRWGKNAGAGAFFVEVWLAPTFSDEAVELIRTYKKWGANVRLLAPGDMKTPPGPDARDYKRIAGGFLLQSKDTVGLDTDQWEIVTKRTPTDVEMNDLRLAWLVCKHTKSNAISVCKNGTLIGNGAGQMSRVMSCRIATWLAKENGHEQALPGAVAASDAFFPFRDGPDILIGAGVRAIIQPGGSKRDADTIAACNERDVAMIFTGTRHFKH